MALSKGAIAGIIIGSVVLLIIIIVVVILILRGRRSSGSGSTTKPPTSTTGCAVDADCGSNAVCNPQTRLCVECRDDSTCSGSKPRCKVTTNKCVRCVENGDCAVGETCDSNICCNTVKPVITNVVSTTTSNNRLDVTFDFFQGTTATAVIVVIEDPSSGFPLFYDKLCPDRPATTCTGNPDCPGGTVCDGGSCKVLGCLSFPLSTAAQSSSVAIIESLLNINFYPGQPYRVKLKVVYTCGTNSNVATAFSDPITHVFAPCTDNPAGPDLLVAGVYGALWLEAFVPPGVGVGSNFQIVLVMTNAPGLHPSFGVRSAPISLLNENGIYVIIPLSAYPANRPLYLRAQRVGSGNQCSSPVGNEVEVTNAVNCCN
jgi:S-adenosylmethionine/arginine decarboxylase-like enzyme